MKRFTILIGLVIIIGLAFPQNPVNYYDPSQIGISYYDLQTWRAMQNRIYKFEDGTLAIVWNMGDENGGTGIGYSYYDGNQWNGPIFTIPSITSVNAVFPSYSAFGENGEICFSEGQDGLIISSREEKGTGEWEETIQSGTNFRHPEIVASGPDHSVIQLLCLDPDPDFAGSDAQPERGSILYSRSTDGGQTWDPQNIVLDGLGTDQYLGFTIGAYAWAQPVNNTIAFVAGDFHTDLLLMKSTDAGDTWQKTVIWEHPYPFFELGTFVSDSFYCNNGGISVVLDNEERAHVSFALTRVFSFESTDSLWYQPAVDGVVYWNEDRETFSNNIHALNPYGHPDSELEEDYSLIGWSQDVNGNGELDLMDNIASYPTPGLANTTQITYKSGNTIIVVWSMVTETYDNGITNFRHIWGRPSTNNGMFWGNFIDFTDDLIYIFSEMVYPAVSQEENSDYLFMTFQEDNVPGLSGPEPPFEQNNIWFYPEDLGWNPVTVQANFTSDTNQILEGETIHFENLSTGYPPDQITYDWEFEGGNPSTSTEKNPVVQYDTHGVYDVKLTAFIQPVASNTMILEDYITVLEDVGISNGEKITWKILPNPASDLITVSAPYGNRVTLILFDQVGREALRQEVSNNAERINLSRLPKGLYFAELKSGNKSEVKKLVLR